MRFANKDIHSRCENLVLLAQYKARHEAACLMQDASMEKARAAMRQMEGSGVARSTHTAVLPSATASLGQKCDSPTCLAREGVGRAEFRRCSACKAVRYCSVHCQQTHWRTSHKQECKKLLQDKAVARAAVGSPIAVA